MKPEPRPWTCRSRSRGGNRPRKNGSMKGSSKNERSRTTWVATTLTDTTAGPISCAAVTIAFLREMSIDSDVACASAEESAAVGTVGRAKAHHAAPTPNDATAATIRMSLRILILDLPEKETLGRSVGRARPCPAGRERGVDLIGVDPAQPDGHDRPRESPNHVPQKPVGGDLERSPMPPAEPARRADRAPARILFAGRRVTARSLGEAPEVVTPHETLGGPAHRVPVERPPDRPGVPAHERGFRHRADRQLIAVRPGDGVVAGVEIGLAALQPRHPDRARQVRVPRAPELWRGHAGVIEVDDLTPGVNARVRASGRDHGGLSDDPLQGLLARRLDRARVRLALPAAKRGSIVLEDGSGPHTHAISRGIGPRSRLLEPVPTGYVGRPSHGARRPSHLPRVPHRDRPVRTPCTARSARAAPPGGVPVKRDPGLGAGDPQASLRAIVAGVDLHAAESEALFTRIMDGHVGSSMIGALLAALAAKGETSTEIAGAARVMRARVTRVPTIREPLVDTCGTGGDHSGSINVSTGAALVVAAAGVAVAKHGNRAASSRCGSADVLEALGVAIDLDPASVGRSIDELGIGFLYAPRFHPAMRHAAEARREIGIRTIFNLLGPLTNPAGARRQLIGVPAAGAVGRIAGVLREL